VRRVSFQVKTSPPIACSFSRCRFEEEKKVSPFFFFVHFSSVRHPPSISFFSMIPFFHFTPPFAPSLLLLVLGQWLLLTPVPRAQIPFVSLYQGPLLTPLTLLSFSSDEQFPLPSVSCCSCAPQLNRLYNRSRVQSSFSPEIFSSSPDFSFFPPFSIHLPSRERGDPTLL